MVYHITLNPEPSEIGQANLLWQVWKGENLEYCGTYQECERWLDYQENSIESSEFDESRKSS